VVLSSPPFPGFFGALFQSFFPLVVLFPFFPSFIVLLSLLPWGGPSFRSFSSHFEHFFLFNLDSRSVGGAHEAFIICGLIRVLVESHVQVDFLSQAFSHCLCEVVQGPELGEVSTDRSLVF